MKIICAKDYNELSRKAANVIAAQVILKPNCVLGLATGSSPIGLYEELVKGYQAGDLDFSGVTTFNLDEYRGLTADHDQSYHYFMHKHLFDSINVPKDRVHVPDGSDPDADNACASYEAAVRAAGGVDLQLLGMGLNGHIGFNEPADEFPKDTHCVDLTESTIEANKRFFASADDVPRQAYTMGIGTIMAARKVLIIVSGENKADIVREAFFGPVTPRVPASILQLHPDVVAVVDEAALAKCRDLL
ncbi:glucosamine-6-phosphate deaminase [Butyricicoccus faecihominis]|uniref:glucosamine-6-phosphate deaminase n=1 Tax=Butyricicoccaceae TaxID=3085642 RepID=UPI002479AA9F|nr:MULTISPECIES: glucosamine-6-phosphate deaminase [Butyricicoccaceae]MCQ5130447.1 glucosamine-6-phosphate deaminase [Butyricicoccus faecihominis]WNX84905.1 glucosamine-6-phosphate deaminase [Agathobaculum sp. NTUH-O15-33]